MARPCTQFQGPLRISRHDQAIVALTTAVRRAAAPVHFAARLWQCTAVSTPVAELIARLHQLEPAALALGAAVGVLLGLALGWLIARARGAGSLADAAGKTSELQTRLEERSQRVAQLDADTLAARQEAAHWREAHAGVSAQLHSERAAAVESSPSWNRPSARCARPAALRPKRYSATASRFSARQGVDGRVSEGATSDLDSRQKAIVDLNQPIRDSLHRSTPSCSRSRRSASAPTPV